MSHALLRGISYGKTYVACQDVSWALVKAVVKVKRVVSSSDDADCREGKGQNGEPHVGQLYKLVFGSCFTLLPLVSGSDGCSLSSLLNASPSP